MEVSSIVVFYKSSNMLWVLSPAEFCRSTNTMYYYITMKTSYYILFTFALFFFFMTRKFAGIPSVLGKFHTYLIPSPILDLCFNFYRWPLLISIKQHLTIWGITQLIESLHLKYCSNGKIGVHILVGTYGSNNLWRTYFDMKKSLWG